jgi:hypothetical protein
MHMHVFTQQKNAQSHEAAVAEYQLALVRDAATIEQVQKQLAELSQQAILDASNAARVQAELRQQLTDLEVDLRQQLGAEQTRFQQVRNSYDITRD